MSILKLLGLLPDENDSGHADPQVESLREIGQALQSLEPEKARFIAVLAYLLGRVARADMKVSPKEMERMVKIITEKAGLTDQQAGLVVEIARRQNRLLGHTDNFLVTREFNRFADKRLKLQVLHCLFAVCTADHSISMAEDRELRQIASELLLEHRDFISVRSAYRNHLSVLRFDKRNPEE